MSESKATDPGLHLFSHVFTYDGKHLGLVVDSTNGYFKVQVRWGRDYWLNSALIRESGPTRVLLHISHEVLEGYKRHELDTWTDSKARPSSDHGANHPPSD